ncbi:CUE domain containing protein [Trichuris trichiura]|uniref:CUE domain containing protein n=1 Tax=Trichuris trichiura TaxID=36087 RepID=A0A077Z033_TRITR|nr:CUE domain containing protein [Trichuris trichiura]
MRSRSKSCLSSFQAMQDFKAMFPSLSPETIEATLRLNNGLVENTIDDLLLLCSPLARNEPAAKHPRTKEPCANGDQSTSSVGVLPRKRKVYSAAMLKPLPRDFLRLSLTSDVAETASSETCRSAERRGVPQAQAQLPSVQQLQKLMDDNFNRTRSTCDPQLRRCLEDERFAIILQNEEFVRELRSDADFMSALQKDNERGAKERTDRASTQPMPVNSSPTADIGPESPASTGSYGDAPDGMGPFPYTKTISEDKNEAYFHEKLRHMGKASKQRFVNLADKFLRKHKGAAGILGTSRTDRSRAQLLPDNGNESAEDDEEATSEGYNQTSDNDYNVRRFVLKRRETNRRPLVLQIGKQKDLKEGRLFGNFRSPKP